MMLLVSQNVSGLLAVVGSLCVVVSIAQFLLAALEAQFLTVGRLVVILLAVSAE